MAEFIPRIAGAVLPALFSSLFGGGSEDVEEAQERAIAERRRAMQQAAGFLQPFREGGIFGMKGLEDISSQMHDPVSFLNRIMAQYQESPGAKFERGQATEALQSQAQSLGLLDSGAERASLANLVSNLASRNQQQFLQNVLGIQSGRGQLLQSLFGGGLGAGQALATGALKTGAGIAGDISGIGEARAAGDISMGEQFGSAVGDLTDVFEDMARKSAEAAAAKRAAAKRTGGGISGGTF